MILRTALAISCLGISNAQAPSDRGQHWREDIQFFASKFAAKGTGVDFKRGIASRGQKDLEKLYPNFGADVAAIEADIPTLSDAEIVLRLMKLVASAHVAHNSVQQPIGLGFFSRLPLEFASYSDGLAIIGASAEYQQAVGTRVLKIGTKTPEEALAGLAPYIGYENDVWLRQVSPGFLRPRPLLDHLGVTDADGRVTLTLEKPGAAPFTVEVPTVDSRTKVEFMHPPVTLQQSQPDRKYYWHQYLRDSGTLYLQYNICKSDPQLSFSDFAKQVLAGADTNKPKQVMIDLRKNGGGDSRVIRPLKSGLADRHVKVFVLIGPNTFSSGTDNAIELRHDLHATLVGEPTGGKPSSYGEVMTITLPNSKLVVRYTTKWFGSHQDSEPEALVPDILAPRSLADVLAGRDPVMEAVK